MHVRRSDDAAEFLDATLEYRDAEPLRTNVLGSVATTVGERGRAGRGRGVLVARAATTTTVSSARRCGRRPYALSLGPMDAACAAVACRRRSPPSTRDLPAVAGFAATVEAFLAAFAAIGTGPAARAALASQRQVLYAAAVGEVPAVPGELSLATEDALELAERWYLEFTEEVDGVRSSPNERRPGHAARDRALGAAAVVARRRARSCRWRGTPRPSPRRAASSRASGPCTRRPRRRRRGYAAALTGQLTAAALGRRLGRDAVRRRRERHEQRRVPTARLRRGRRARPHAARRGGAEPPARRAASLASSDGRRHDRPARTSTHWEALARFHGTGDDGYYDLDLLRAGGTLMGDEERAAIDARDRRARARRR